MIPIDNIDNKNIFFEKLLYIKILTISQKRGNKVRKSNYIYTSLQKLKDFEGG